MGKPGLKDTCAFLDTIEPHTEGVRKMAQRPLFWPDMTKMVITFWPWFKHDQMTIFDQKAQYAMILAFLNPKMGQNGPFFGSKSYFTHKIAVFAYKVPSKIAFFATLREKGPSKAGNGSWKWSFCLPKCPIFGLIFEPKRQSNGQTHQTLVKMSHFWRQKCNFHTFWTSKRLPNFLILIKTTGSFTADLCALFASLDPFMH